MTLDQIIARQIRANGPITLAEYMTLCLTHPEHGFYITRDPFGAAGDFTTAPEISQMFGELLGLAMAQNWLDAGQPERVILAELGPGRGTLMADLLRAAKSVPGFHAAVEVHLVETSDLLRQRQTQTIGLPVTHHDQVETVPRGAPLYLVANEFFDALPIRQFQRDPNGWRERLVGVTDNGLGFGLSEPMRPEVLDHRLDDTETGDIVEVSQAAHRIASEIGAHIASDGGLALIVDYGDWHSLGDTFQALHQHAPVSPFASPGGADLTAHVDFESLATSAAPALHSRLTPQGVFLERLGIVARTEALATKLDGQQLDNHRAAYHRLTQPSEMGTLFKVLALYPEGAPLPPGFAP